MMLIIAQLTEDVYGYKHTAGNTYGQAENVDKNIALLLADVAQGRLDIVFDHGGSFIQ
jgi:hypothetical protein